MSKDIVELAGHILDRKAGHFDAEALRWKHGNEPHAGRCHLQKAHRGNRKTWKRLSNIACETTKEPRPDTNQLDKTYLTRMCGRYDNLIPRNAYSALFRAARVPRSNFPPRYNVAPTDQIPIVRIDPRDGERELAMARWGLIPFWMKEKPKVPHINARAETVHKLPLFREAFAKRRCLIPATGFYEWQQRSDGKQPYRFRRKDLEPFAFAGIWEFARLNGEEILSAAMIVGEPNPLVGGVHDRMPVMLLTEDYDAWLGSATAPEDLRTLLRPYDESLMEAYAVSRKVNSVKNDTEECIEPIDDDPG